MCQNKMIELYFMKLKHDRNIFRKIDADQCNYVFVEIKPIICT